MATASQRTHRAKFASLAKSGKGKIGKAAKSMGKAKTVKKPRRRMARKT